MSIIKFGRPKDKSSSAGRTCSEQSAQNQERHTRKLNVDKLGGSKFVYESEQNSANEPTREIWDDYGILDKRSKKKKVYSKGIGNRMIPVQKNIIADAPTTTVAEADSFDMPRPCDDYDALEARLGATFSDRTLLKRALTHRSALGMSERADYERLEFLGDAVFDLVVAHLLSDSYPEAREGELSKMRAALVNTQALAKIARKLEIGQYIRLGRGEYSSGGNDRASILADVMEAIIGALYRDRGYEIVMPTVSHIFGDELGNVTPHDPKTELQEVLHIAGSEPPSYLLELVEGPEHAPIFVTVVMVDNEVGGRGRGSTKKASQQEAASIALARMRATCQTVELLANQRELIPEAFMTAQMSGLSFNVKG